MNRPKIVSVFINWIDEENKENSLSFGESTLEEAHDIIGLMIGDITEEDLKP